MSTFRRKSNAGTVALEFAMIGSALIGMLIVIFELGFMFFAQTSMDYAAASAARQMQTGQATAADPVSFQSLVFCPFLAPLLNCGNVSIVLQPVTNFQSGMTTAPGPYNSGSSGSLMLLQATYAPGLPIWPLTIMSVVGTAAYQNE